MEKGVDGKIEKRCRGKIETKNKNYGYQEKLNNSNLMPSKKLYFFFKLKNYKVKYIVLLFFNWVFD